MGGDLTGGSAAAQLAFAGAALAIALGSAGFLRRQHRRYGRLAGWPGQVTAAVLATGIGLAAYAVWPLPPGTDGLCAPDGGAPAHPRPLAALTALPPAHAALAAGVLVPLGLLLRYRYRRGVLAAVAVCAAVAAAVEAVQYTALLGAYPCAYRTAALDDVLLGAAGGLAGWLLGLAADRVLPRSWPGALADALPPALGRRLLGHLLDVAVCWSAATAAAALLTALPVPGRAVALAADPLRDTLFAALAAVFAVAVPLLRRDRATPGRAALYLALAGAGAPRPAGRPRVLARAALVWLPVGGLLVAGLPWWTLAVAALHGSTAVVRRDRAGLFDLVAGTRTTTRAALLGGLPDRLMRYTRRAEPAPAAP
ncbi:VanZ family protein [Streptomonospora sp. S1-112]|uniref:VanZ family protein n=1 Tax=Streptomonospora mangrovi TaxID=2883123 RepID=A0A9X3NQD6_9ACTN|nr:VanZ family protein [Streptomonospora mangrovi]MDA0567967.1 VanZ family protein [Streptomonospora mangrovi]